MSLKAGQSYVANNDAEITQGGGQNEEKELVVTNNPENQEMRHGQRIWVHTRMLRDFV